MSAIRDIADNGLGGVQHNFLTGRVEDLVRWSRSRSSWGATLVLPVAQSR
jgi:NADH-quinone oxidoreductase subunit B